MSTARIKTKLKKIFLLQCRTLKVWHNGAQRKGQIAEYIEEFINLIERLCIGYKRKILPYIGADEKEAKAHEVKHDDTEALTHRHSPASSTLEMAVNATWTDLPRGYRPRGPVPVTERSLGSAYAHT